MMIAEKQTIEAMFWIRPHFSSDDDAEPVAGGDVITPSGLPMSFSIFTFLGLRLHWWTRLSTPVRRRRAMKILRAICLFVAAVYFLLFAFNISESGYSSERGFYTSGYDGSSRFGPLLFSAFCVLCYLGLVGYSYYRPRFVASPAVSTTRKLIPIIFFGALTIFAASYGIYYAVLCLRELFAASVTAWRYFLAAEFALLFAWRFLVLALISLAIHRRRLRNEQVSLKRGAVGRVWFMVSTGAAGFGYLVAKSLFDMPWWFTHLGHAVIAVLMFCTFTYPWSRRHPTTPNTALEPTPTTPPVLTKP